MYCSKCGCELQSGIKFCPNCGQKVAIINAVEEEQKSTIKYEGEYINPIPLQEKENNSQKKDWHAKLKEKFVCYWNNLDNFLRFLTICMMVCLVLSFISFLCDKIFASLVSILQIVLLIAAYLTYVHIIKVKKQWLHISLVIIACLLVIPWFAFFRLNISKNSDIFSSNQVTKAKIVTEELQWPKNELASMLPVPKSQKGYIQKNSSDELCVYVVDVAKVDYKTYINECVEKGFDLDGIEERNTYSAKNGMGYRLTLVYQEEETMIITIQEPLVPVQLELNCISNLLFSKYDIEIYVDDVKIGKLQHGTENTFKAELEEGEHTLKLTKENDNSVDGFVSFEIQDTVKISYEISCHSDSIEIDEKYIESLSPLSEGKAKLPTSSEDYKYQSVEMIQDDLINAGFTNIKIEEIQDLTGKWFEQDGKIENISIGGKTEFRKAEIFDKNVEIVITCHTVVPKTEEEINSEENIAEKELFEPETSEEETENADVVKKKLEPYIGKTVAELIPVLSELGYTATYTAENTGMDFTESLQEDVSMQKIFVITDFQNIDISLHTVEVMMLGKDTIEEQEKQDETRKVLQKKLDETTAWEAVQRYGKSQYSSFKLHYLAGQLASKAEDENTWFLKAICDIKTLNGKVKGLTCEARVTGTTDNPEVIYFIVY